MSSRSTTIVEISEQDDPFLDLSGEGEEDGEGTSVVQPDEAPRKMTLEVLLGAMPPPEKRLMEAEVSNNAMSL